VRRVLNYQRKAGEKAIPKDAGSELIAKDVRSVLKGMLAPGNVSKVKVTIETAK